MFDDYPAKSRSDDEIRAVAKRTQAFFGVANDVLVDVVRCVKQPRLQTVFGEKRLAHCIKPDEEMVGEDGVTTYGSAR